MRWATDSLILGIFMVTAITALVLSLMAYMRARTRKLLLLSTAILVFVAKGCLILVETFLGGSLNPFGGSYLLFDVAAISLIVLSGLWE